MDEGWRGCHLEGRGRKPTENRSKGVVHTSCQQEQEAYVSVSLLLNL